MRDWMKIDPEGKYEVKNDNGILSLRRHGVEFKHDAFTGSGFFLAMVHEIERLRELESTRIKAVREASRPMGLFPQDVEV